MGTATGRRLDVRHRPGVQERAFLLLDGPAHRLWDAVAERLAVRGHPVYALDLHGPGEEHDTAATAADVAAASAVLGLSGVIVAGRLWAAGVALRLAAESPELVAGLALVDPAPETYAAGPGPEGAAVPWRTCRGTGHPGRLTGDLIDLAGEVRRSMVV